MWIKICANTNLADASLAAELGADALGFVFAPSPRRVTPEQVAAITPHLPAAIEKIGVFQTQDPAEITSTVRTAGLTGAQLHSYPSSNLAATLAVELPGIRIIQTLHWTRPNDFPPQVRLVHSNPHIHAVLVDSRTATASGGTGIAFDWNAARANLTTLAPLRLVVAGGLTPANVREAIATLEPWGIDVASGVESSPGRKDPARLAAFLANARQATPPIPVPAR
jgi:phosphoribosylanthranilate isomerase